VSSGQKQLEGGHQTRAHSDQLVLVMAKQGGWNVIRWWPQKFKSKLNLKGDYKAGVHSGPMFLWWSGREAGLP
jgi:hypothetical protein